MDVCKLCQNEKKNLGSHVRQAHKMSMDEYKLLDSVDTEFTDELSEHVESNVRTNNKKREEIILDLPQEITEDMTVKNLCLAKGLTLKDLGAIIKQFNSGKRLDVTQSVKLNENRGEREARKLAANDKTSTEDQWVAAALCEKFGFEVDEVTRNPNKTWWLSKAA